MRILGIDFGDRRIGLAISDPFGWTASGLETIKWDNDIHVAANKIRDIVKKNSVEKIVVGMPLNLNGTFGPRGEQTVEFINLLKKKIKGMEIVTWDERWSTVAANKIMIETNVQKTKKKGLVDKFAAVYILQGYLDSLR